MNIDNIGYFTEENSIDVVVGRNGDAKDEQIGRASCRERV